MTAALVFAGLGLVVAIALGLARRALAHIEGEHEGDLVEAIDALLPQTQCAQCGYPGCRPYAAAVAQGAALDLCAPGGGDTTRRIAALLGRDPERENMADAAPVAMTARIREAECIGCTLCIEACPVDAIIGAAQFMHVVLPEHCTGCELCVAPCPVDCIDMVAR